MSFAIYWTVSFTVFLILLEKTYSRDCHKYHPMDGQCFIGCYYNNGACYNCANCTTDQLVDIESYHQNECITFPAFCRGQSSNVDWREYATDFHPIHLPPLIDSFIGYDDQWRLMFFQEDSHPMIGKVCENEFLETTTDWFTFQKARLKCTSQDGVIYSSIVAVENLSYNNSFYLTLLTSSVDNQNQSALCLFKDTDIERVMNSNTYFDPSYSNEWRKFPSSKIPNDPYERSNIGVCSKRSGWTDQQKNFIRTHPLMYNNVTARQVLAEGDGLFTALASIQKKGRDGRRYAMVFIGTDDGRILKYAWSDLDTTPNFLEEIYVTRDPSTGITNLEIVGNPLELNISTTDAAEPLYEPLERCKDMKIQCVCEQDPYCTWKDDDGSCRSFDWNDNRCPTQLGKCSINVPYISSQLKSIPQPPITKISCEGIAPSSALLVTNRHDRPINGDSSATTSVPKTTEAIKLGRTNGPGIGAKTVPIGAWTVSLFLVCALVLLIVLGVILFLMRILWKKSPTTQGFPLDGKDWISDWTSITFNQKVPYLKLKDTTEGGTEYTGKVVRNKTIFEDLKPLTQYEVIHQSDRSPFVVKTEGPSFSDWETTVNTAQVETGGCQDQYVSQLVLKCDGGISPKMTIEESMVFSGLTPNMKYFVWLEVRKKNSEKIITKCITDVTTKEESFHVEMDDGKLCLMWSNLSSGIERYIQSCRCGEFKNFLTDMDSLVSGSKELPPHPQHATFNLKVMTKIQGMDGGELEHILASVPYETPRLDLVKLPEQSSSFPPSLPEYNNELVMTTTQDDALDSDDSSSRVHSLPVSEGDSEGSVDDSSSKIRSAPILGSDCREVATQFARQMSQGNQKVTVIMADRANVILNSQVSFNNGSSTSSGIGSMLSSQSSFVELPYKGYGLQIGTDCYQCSATLHSLTSSKLRSEVQHKLAMKIFNSREEVIPCLCELLNYSRDEAAVFVKFTETSSDNSLGPIRDREVQSEQIFIVTLLYKLMEILMELSQSSQMDRKEELVNKMDSLYSVISFLATITHEDCPACKAVLDSVNHLWICGGYTEDLKKDEIALSMR